MKKYITLGVLSVLTPTVVLAAVNTSSGLGRIVVLVKDFISLLVPVVIAAAVLFFLYGLAKYLWSVADEKKSEGKEIMIWGIVGLFVMVSVWGLVNLLSQTLGLDSSINIENPINKVQNI